MRETRRNMCERNKKLLACGNTLSVNVAGQYVVLHKGAGFFHTSAAAE